MQEEKKTVGIMTLHKQTHSYGAVMQAYATYTILKDLGYSPQIIDLCLESRLTLRLSKRFPIPSQAMRRHVINGLIVDYLKHPFRIYRFRQFNKLIAYSKTYHKTDDLYRNPPKYDIYLVGSDQVWNPCLIHNIEPFLLTFLTGDEKRISYSSSIGRTSIPLEYAPLFREALSKFQHISVRELPTKKIITSILPDADISVTLDTTMLITKEHWISLSENVKYSNYILCYLLHNELNKLRFAEQVAKHNGLQLIVVGDKVRNVNAKFLNQIGPKKWLGLIRNAQHIITDSFHGMVFSIILNGNFLVLCNETDKETRINHLLNLLKLKGHITDNYNHPYKIHMTAINSYEVASRLDMERNNSFSYLFNALKN